MRWIGLVCFIILAYHIYQRRMVGRFVIALCAGAAIGLTLDYFLGYKLGLWYFPRQEYWTVSYWAIVLPSWAVFGALINMPWDMWQSKKWWFKVGVLSLALASCYEVVNLVTGSWIYDFPTWGIAIGWLPLLFTYRGVYAVVVAVYEGSWDWIDTRGETQKHTMGMLFIGGIVWLLYLGYVNVLTLSMGVPHLIAEGTGIPISWVINYGLNTTFNFKQSVTTMRAMSFCLISGVGWVMFLLTTIICTDILGWHPSIGPGIGVISKTGMNIVMQQVITFGRLGERQALGGLEQ